MRDTVFLNNESFENNINNFFECNYLKEIIRCLHLQENKNVQEAEIYIYISPSSEVEIKPKKSSCITICIIIDEYLNEMPELLDSFDFVFQAYISKISLNKRYFHFPLGYSRQLQSCENYSLSLRGISVFFSGNLHRGRKGFYNGLIKQHWIPFSILHRIQHVFKFKFDFLFKDSYIRFTNGFGKGLSSIEYTEKLFDSKIVLCPSGIANVESFRLYEAMKAGCIIISEPLPDKPFYEGIPIISIDSWDNIQRVVSDLLLDIGELDAKQKDVISFWEKNLSEKAVANYMLNCISSSLE